MEPFLQGQTRMVILVPVKWLKMTSLGRQNNTFKSFLYMITVLSLAVIFRANGLWADQECAVSYAENAAHYVNAPFP